MFDYEAELTVRRQLADKIRARIEAGEWGPRRRLPSVTHLEQQYEVSRDTVIKALDILRSLNVIYTVKNRGSFVLLGADDVVAITPGPGMRIISRAPSPEEREEMQIPDGVPVIVVEDSGTVKVYRADLTEIRGRE